MHHQIPTSSSVGGDQTLQTTADVLRCEAQIETWGVRFALGGWGCLSPPRYELSVCLLHGSTFDTLQDAPTPRQKPFPVALGILDFPTAKIPLVGSGPRFGFESSVSHKPEIPAWLLAAASNTQICFLNIVGLVQSHDHVIPAVQATAKKTQNNTTQNKNKVCVLERLILFSGFSVERSSREACWLVGIGVHRCGTQRGRRTSRPEPQTSQREQIGATGPPKKRKQMTGNSQQQSKKGKMFVNLCSNRVFFFFVFCEWLKGHLMVSDGPTQLHTSLVWKQNWWHVWKGSGLQVRVSASRLLYDWDEDELVSFSLLELELRLWRTEKRQFLHEQLLWETKKKKVMLWSTLIISASAEGKQ